MSLDAPIYNSLRTLLLRLTPARAIQLDALDAPISSRAPAASALSTATWTAPRAAALDTIPGAYGHFVALFGSAETINFLIANPSLTPANFATWAQTEGALTQLTVLHRAIRRTRPGQLQAPMGGHGQRRQQRLGAAGHDLARPRQ